MFNHVPVNRIQATRQTINESRFYETESGELYPSITTVLSHQENVALDEWRNRVGEQEARRISEEATERGTEFHEALENILNNSDIEFDCLLRSAPLVKQFVSLSNRIDNIRGLELPLYSDELRVAGTADCVAEYKGELSVIDFKTSKRTKLREWITDYFIQCTAYALMYMEHYDEDIDNIVVIICSDDGIPMVFQDSIMNHIQPLCDRIDAFYVDRPQYK